MTVVFSRFFLRSVSWASQYVFVDNCYELLVNKAPLVHETLWHFKLWILLMGEESKTHNCFSFMTAQRHARCLRWFGRSSYTHWGQGVQIENLMSFDPWILNLVNEDTKSTPTLSQEKKMQIEILHSFSCGSGVKLPAALVSWWHLKLLRAKTFPSCDQVPQQRSVATNRSTFNIDTHNPKHAHNQFTKH